MSEETATTPAATDEVTPEATETEEQRVPYERFDQANKKAKAADARAKAAEKTAADLQAQIEARESAGLPEVEQLKKRLEAAEKRAEEADTKAAEADTRLQETQKERWITAAAKEFADPDDVVAILQRQGKLADIETAADAERAVKAVAKDPAKKHLLKTEETVLPGRVLKDGQRTTTEEQNGGPNLAEEAQQLAEGLRQFASKS